MSAAAAVWPQEQGVRGCVRVPEQGVRVRLRVRDANVCDRLRVRVTMWTSGGIELGVRGVCMLD